MKSTVNIKALPASPDFKVLSISGQAGDILYNHKVSEPSVLLLRNGSITFREGGAERILNAGEIQHITAEVFHEVQCNESAEFFVVIPKQAKMRFEQ